MSLAPDRRSLDVDEAPRWRLLPMARRWLHHPLLWSPIIALGIQLILATAVAACSGGADWPRR